MRERPGNNGVWRMARGFVAAAVVASVASLGLVLSVPKASADSVSVSLPAHLTVGPAPGPCPMARVDGRRSGRVVELPSAPRELWHRRVRGGTSLPVAVDETGAVVVAAAVAELVQVDADGREQWHQRLGMSVASTEPVILSDGTRVVLTTLGQAWGFDARGGERFRTDLAGFGTDPRTSPLPRDDGSVVVAVGTHLVVLGRDGSVMLQADVGQRVVGSVVSDGRAVLVTTETGDVVRWASPLPPRRVGTFRGIVREGVARTTDGKLLAVVDMQRLVSMDLSTGATATRLSSYGLEGPPAVGDKGMFHVANNAGVLHSVSSAGQERGVRLDPAPEEPPDPDGGVVVPSYAPPSPSVVVDEAGRVAFARSDGRVGVVSPDGRVSYVSKRSCGTPISVTPAGRRKFVVACRTGDLYLYGP